MFPIIPAISVWTICFVDMPEYPPEYPPAEPPVPQSHRVFCRPVSYPYPEIFWLSHDRHCSGVVTDAGAATFSGIGIPALAILLR